MNIIAFTKTQLNNKNMEQETNFNDEVEIRNKRFLGYLRRLESQGHTLKQILHLAESINADGIVAACKEHIRNTLSTIPDEQT